ncbi:hypothetical protein JA1_004058 [Spathaspora sp. JA1]|nr:hypothetical protein JA1_004058 [Spathaspora sp. JA1]
MVEFIDLPDDILFQIYDNLEVFSIKKLQYFPKLTHGVRLYLYGHSQYLICMDEDPRRISHEQEQENTYDDSFMMAGYRMSKLVDNESMRKHISHFKYYQIEITICKFEETLKLLEHYQNIIYDLFGQDEGSKNIKLHIRLHYSLNTFNDIKDCLVNMDKISHFFNSKNSVQIDLELNRR